MGSDEEKLIFEAQTKHGIINDLLEIIELLNKKKQTI